jgi:HlyD family secretion protein
MKSVVTVLAVVGIGAAAAFYWRSGAGASSTTRYRTAAANREEIVVVINATGTVQPEEVVDIGAQVAGRIVAFGKEPKSGSTIDYGSEVEPGTVLARIDDAIYLEEANVARAQVSKAEAHLEQTRTQLNEAAAAVARAEADLKQMEARFAQAERDWGRAQKLVGNNALSQQEFDTFRAAYETSQATVGVGKAALLQAQSAVETAKAVVTEGTADVEAAKATLARAERNLGYTTIASPIAGVIIDRRVNIGQTVVASLNAPSLFLIAKDLKRIQVWASVNEADIGRIKKDQPVNFTFDAYPGETFVGKVGQVRLNASMTQNVVTYTVIVNADNDDGKLLPYLTANLQFEVARRSDALVVPNTALRWRPKPEQIAPQFRAEYAGDHKPKDAQAVVWVVDGDFVRPIVVRTGIADSGKTEIISAEVGDGTMVVTGEAAKGDASTEVNPFAPKVYGGGSGSRS